MRQINADAIETLLREWARNAPAEIEKGAVYWYLDGGAIEVVNGLALKDFDAIQGAVQRGLDDRGIHWRLESGQVSRIKTATIRPTQDGAFVAVADDVGAIALLKAYLECFEVWSVAGFQTEKTAQG
jgi:hypothetical protein